MKFTKPTEEQIQRMTPKSIGALLQTLRSQRADLVAPYDLQIKYYEDLLKKKEEAQNAEATSSV